MKSQTERMAPHLAALVQAGCNDHWAAVPLIMSRIRKVTGDNDPMECALMAIAWMVPESTDVLAALRDGLDDTVPNTAAISATEGRAILAADMHERGIPHKVIAKRLGITLYEVRQHLNEAS